MSNFGKLVLALLLVAGLGLLVFALRVGQRPKHPNVLLIVCDTLRADRLHAKRDGVDVAPYLAQLCRESLSFPNAMSPSSWTRPAMASLFTSRYLDAHGVSVSAENEDPDRPVSDRLPNKLETITEYLVRHGYRAFGISTNANCTKPLGFAQGFEEFVFQNGFLANWVTRRALELIDGKRGPIFLYAHYMDPHAAYVPPEDVLSLFGPAPALAPHEQHIIDDEIAYMDYARLNNGNLLGKTPPPDAPLSEAAMEELRRRYDAETRFMDGEIAKLVRTIRQRNEETIVIVVSDHGEEFWEHGGVGHGTTLYEEQLRVPFFISVPGRAPQEYGPTIETLHMLPTLAGLLGLAASPQWQGRDLLNNPPVAAPVYSRTLGSWPPLGIDLESVQQAHLKLIVDRKHAKAMLFDLVADPGETQDLAPARPEQVESLCTLIEAHRAANLAVRPEPSPGEAAEPMDPELVEQLRALGYLQDVEPGAAAAETPAPSTPAISAESPCHPLR